MLVKLFVVFAFLYMSMSKYYFSFVSHFLRKRWKKFKDFLIFFSLVFRNAASWNTVSYITGASRVLGTSVIVNTG